MRLLSSVGGSHPSRCRALKPRARGKRAAHAVTCGHRSVLLREADGFCQDAAGSLGSPSSHPGQGPALVDAQLIFS